MSLSANDFNIFKLDNLECYIPSFGRKDLYRICLVKGNSRVNYNDQSVDMSGTYLFFGNVNIPYSWEVETNDHSGYCCLFTENFLKGIEHLQNFRDFSPFNSVNIPVYALKDEQQVLNADFVFRRIFEVYHSDLPNRRDMLRTLINLIMHEAIAVKASAFHSASGNEIRFIGRYSAQFLKLLDAQFPIENKNKSIHLTTPADFAEKLGVHPNYLNRCVKLDTGKTALRMINDRIITEARVLLEYTDWTVSEISNCLGFEYHSYFDNVFKKFTGLNPKAYREQLKSSISNT